MSSLSPFETQVAQNEVVKERDSRKLILYNDDVNTFDHVIDSLIKYCNHEPVQAEQCAWIVHNNGRCDVKRGGYKQLRPICEVLLEKGLSAEIE